MEGKKNASGEWPEKGTHFLASNSKDWGEQSVKCGGGKKNTTHSGPARKGGFPARSGCNRPGEKKKRLQIVLQAGKLASRELDPKENNLLSSHQRRVILSEAPKRPKSKRHALRKKGCLPYSVKNPNKNSHKPSYTLEEDIKRHKRGRLSPKKRGERSNTHLRYGKGKREVSCSPGSQEYAVV